VHEFVKTSLRVHRNEKGWKALAYINPHPTYSIEWRIYASFGTSCLNVWRTYASISTDGVEKACNTRIKFISVADFYALCWGVLSISFYFFNNEWITAHMSIHSCYHEIKGVTRLDGAWGKKQVWRPCGRTGALMVEVWRPRGGTWTLSKANLLYWGKYLWHCWDFLATPAVIRLPAVIQRPHSELAPGQLCPLSPSLRPCMKPTKFIEPPGIDRRACHQGLRRTTTGGPTLRMRTAQSAFTLGNLKATRYRKHATGS